jgi:hypothetical protein
VSLYRHLVGIAVVAGPESLGMGHRTEFNIGLYAQEYQAHSDRPLLPLSPQNDFSDSFHDFLRIFLCSGSLWMPTYIAFPMNHNGGGNRIYDLVMRQEPKQARMCGVGGKGASFDS